jgi:hypothetical protein
LDTARIQQDEATDGVFPLITNQHDMPALEVLQAYKRQPLIEKRFSQFKSDFEVAPVYLKEVTRIQGLLCISFFALMVQALLERELRLALAHSDYDAIPLYPEHRACHAPTTRRVLDIFENVQRHRLGGRTAERQTFVTQLTPLQRQIATWLGLHLQAGRPPACQTALFSPAFMQTSLRSTIPGRRRFSLLLPARASTRPTITVSGWAQREVFHSSSAAAAQRQARPAA